MRNIWTIARREIKLYFGSPIAYIVGLLIFLITGIYFVLTVYLAGQSAYTSGSATAPGPDLVVGLMVFLFLFAVPALSMRLMADEHRNGTLELLLTAPIHESELVIGKWLGSFLFVFLIILVTFIYPIVLNGLVTPGIDQGLMMANYLAITLVAASFWRSVPQFLASLITSSRHFLPHWPCYSSCGWSLVASCSDARHGQQYFTYLSMSNHFSSMQSRHGGALPISFII